MLKVAEQDTIQKLKIALLKELPQHDTPIGLIHPYWARKPLNIIDLITTHLSNDGDVVYDPFVGSGTVAYSALSNKRRALASDLNPLAIYISDTVLSLADFTVSDLTKIEQFFLSLEDQYLKWFSCDKSCVVERIRYLVKGSYVNGNFELKPIEIITKTKVGKKWKGRLAKKPTQGFLLRTDSKYMSKPINFDKISLEENSRIAIPKGAKFSHFFDAANRATINFILSEIKKSRNGAKIKNALYFIVSSSIPLLRLSDKKASSQWPYWRPKTELTSRNPAFVIRKRVKAFIEAAEWAASRSHGAKKRACSALLGANEKDGYSVFESSVQDIIKKGVVRESVDLIITDPPYADQVPYLEYSELWNRLILGCSGKAKFSQEIVKTNAPKRKKDDADYIDRLSVGFEQCCKVLKKNGHFVFFYQDRNLEHWAEINRTLNKNNVFVVEVVALPKQRRSMKSVTTPGRTFDGDLLIIARKENVGINNKKSHLRLIEKTKPNSSKDEKFFFQYADIIRQGLIQRNLDEVAEVETDIYAIL